ncbi:MFS transporter [Streptomyces longisporoflavus]|uniref:MFS transporter n=1 Tax=Streptomyces longisporoflavus TaxID=28044 RepID=A0ABW7QHE2_9ACTN
MSGSARPAAVLGVLAAAQFVVVLSTSIVNVALPSVRDGVGLSGTGMAWVVNAYGLAFGALLLLGGRAADLAGRRRVLLTGLSVFVAASLAAALATEPWLLIVARAAQGVGAAAVAPAALSLLMYVFPAGPGRGRALGVWGAVSGAGGAAGVLLGGVLTESMGWRSVFHATALGAAVVLAAGVRWVPRASTEGDDLPRLDLAGALSVTLGLVALVYSVTTAGRTGWTDPLVLGMAAAAAVLLALFAAIEHRHSAPLLPPRLLSRGSVAPANLVMALLGAVWVGLFFFLPLYQQQVLGDGPLRTGLAQLPLAAANMAGAFLAPRLARRVGASVTLVAGMAALSGGLLWLSGISANGTFTGDVLGPTLVIGLGLGIAFVQLTGAAVAGVPAGDAGLAGGLVNTTRQLGGALGLAVLATLAASRTASAGPGTSHAMALTEGYRTAFLVSAAVAAAGAALAPLLTRTPAKPARTKETTR